jgi:hypothetical protein
MKKILKANKKELFKKAGVQAVGLGFKKKDKITSNIKSIIVSVDRKLPLGMIKKKDRIPMVLDGVLTDVVETNIIKTMHTNKHRPATGGTSIGHVDITAGTFGCLVKQESNIFILSNNHVLACSNEAEIGDSIIQPGAYDNGKYPEDYIATLKDFVPIEIGGLESFCPIGNFIKNLCNCLAKLTGSKTRFTAIRLQSDNENLVDCAIAKPLELKLVTPEIMEIGLITDVISAQLGMKIKKSGRTTGLTHGTVEQTDVTVNVQYGEGKIAVFKDQLMAGTMCAGGDSGSVVLTEDNQLLGLLFAGSENSTIINRIENVFELLHLTGVAKPKDLKTF